MRFLHACRPAGVVHGDERLERLGPVWHIHHNDRLGLSPTAWPPSVGPSYETETQPAQLLLRDIDGTLHPSGKNGGVATN